MPRVQERLTIIAAVLSYFKFHNTLHHLHEWKKFFVTIGVEKLEIDIHRCG